MLTRTPVVTKGKAPSPGSAVSEKVRTRLEELDDLEEVCVLNVCLNFTFVPQCNSFQVFLKLNKTFPQILFA